VACVCFYVSGVMYACTVHVYIAHYVKLNPNLGNEG
jgi:hypothetical protein